MKITKKYYRTALREIESIMDAEPGTREGDLLDLFASIVEKYEKKLSKLPEPEWKDVLYYNIEQRGLTKEEIIKTLNKITS